MSTVKRTHQSRKKPEPIPVRVVIDNWRTMIDTLEGTGYSCSKVARLTGVPRRTVTRWWNGGSAMPSWKVFSNVLCLYCYVICCDGVK